MHRPASGLKEISDVAEVTAEGSFKTIDDLKKALKVVPKEGVKLTEGVDYEITYGEVKDGKVTVTVTGIGNYAGTIVSTFMIEPDEKTVITLPEPTR